MGDRDGTITLPEFKRELLAMGVKAPSDDVEMLFKTLDEKSSGEVVLLTFKRRMLEIQEKSIVTEAALLKAEAELAVLQQRCLLAEEALQAEETAQREEASIVPLDEELTVDARFWKLLQEHQLFNISKLIQTWDNNSDGCISKGEFRQKARKLGLVASNKEIDGLFSKLDENNDNTLEASDLKNFITKYQGEVEEQVRQLEEAQLARKQRAVEMRMRASATAAALMAEVVATRQEQKLKQVRESIPLDVRLAEAMLQNGMESSSRILRSWTSTKGKHRRIVLNDFIKGVKQLNVDLNDDEVLSPHISMKRAEYHVFN
ncbi:MAG: hypothetical protein SGPRY_009861 [Prymnesium sp.]